MEEQGEDSSSKLCVSLVFPHSSSLPFELIYQHSAPCVPIKQLKSEKDLAIVPMLIRWFSYRIVVMLGVTIGRSWVKDTGDLFVLFLLLSVSPSIIISKEKLSSTHFYSTESYLTTRFPSISNWFGLLALHIISTLYRACFPMICATALSIHVYLHMYCIYLHVLYIVT